MKYQITFHSLFLALTNFGWLLIVQFFRSCFLRNRFNQYPSKEKFIMRLIDQIQKVELEQCDFRLQTINQENLRKIEIMTDQVENHILQKYTLIKKVGSGAYGHVWKVTDNKSGEVLALKKIFDAFQHSTDAQRTYREIVFLHELNHPNIIKLSNVIKADNEKDLYLVFEYMEADLHNAIGQKILKDAHNRYILYQIVKGLKFMHSAEVIHRDLKPSNLLLNSDCHLKICDFGLARSLAVDKNDVKDNVLTEEVATRWYRAPEVLLGSNFYDKSADVWSIGCILAEILIGKPIFPGNSTLNQLERILSFTGKPKPQDVEALNSETAPTMINEVNIKQKPLNEWFKSSVPQDALDLLTSMLAINPSKRPSAAQILKHPYLASFHKPKEQIVSDKVIHPPINDNTKLNLKEYRKLIYERIKKLYSYEKQVSKPSNTVPVEPAQEMRKSVERSIGRAQHPNQNVEKKYVHSQENEDKEVVPSKYEKIQRPASQNVPKKTSSTDCLYNNASIIRNTKTSNSSYISPKNVPQRYSSASNQKKGVSPCNVQPKHSTSSHHSATQQYTSEQTEGMKKKNSLKDILRAKKQVTVESGYNVSQMPNPAVKAQTGSYLYNPTQVPMSSSTGNLKQYPVNNHYVPGHQPRYTSYQSTQPTSSMPNQHYGAIHSSSGYSSSMQANYIQHVPYNSSSSQFYHQGASMKENRMLY